MSSDEMAAASSESRNPPSSTTWGVTIRVTQLAQGRNQRTFSLLEPEPTRGLEPRTYRLQDSPSTLTKAATSDFTVYRDRSDR